MKVKKPPQKWSSKPATVVPPYTKPTQEPRRGRSANGWELLDEYTGMGIAGPVVVDGMATMPMSPNRIAKLEKIMQIVLWMLNVMALPGASDHPGVSRTYQRYFKDLGSKWAVYFILECVRDLVQAFANRKLPSFTETPVRIVATVDKTHGRSLAACLWGLSSPTIVLYPSFWEQRDAFEQFHLDRLEPEYYRDMESTAATLFHEFVHMVSEHYWDKLHQMIPKAISHKIPFSLLQAKYIADIRASGEGPWVEDKRRPETRNMTAYGVESCTALAKMDDGDVRSLLNADSYTCFVAETIYTYLAALLDPESDDELDKANDEMDGLVRKHRPKLQKEHRGIWAAENVAGKPRSFLYCTLPLFWRLSPKSQAIFRQKAKQVTKIMASPAKDVPIPANKWWVEENFVLAPSWPASEEVSTTTRPSPLVEEIFTTALPYQPWIMKPKVRNDKSGRWPRPKFEILKPGTRIVRPGPLVRTPSLKPRVRKDKPGRWPRPKFEIIKPGTRILSPGPLVRIPSLKPKVRDHKPGRLPRTKLGIVKPGIRPYRPRPLVRIPLPWEKL